MRRSLFAAVVATALFASGGTAFAQNAMGSGHSMGSGSAMLHMSPSTKTGGNVGPLAASLQGKPVVARIYAGWCPVCKAERGTVSALQAKYGSAIAFVELDVTNAKTAGAAAAKARALGLERFFDAHKASTGTIAVINPQTGAVAATLYNVTSEAPYITAIDKVAQQLHG